METVSRLHHLVVTLSVVAAFHAYALWLRPSKAVDLLVLLTLAAVVIALLRRRGETAHSLGFAVDDRARRAMRLLVPYFAITALGSLAFFELHGPLEYRPLLPGFVLAALLYPLWGLLQQLLYLGFVQGGLLRAGVPQGTAAVVAAVLFGLVHAPNWPLVGLTLAMGLVLTAVYARERALVPAAIAHGFGGACALYLLGMDLEIGRPYVP